MRPQGATESADHNLLDLGTFESIRILSPAGYLKAFEAG
jgi:hypothetical protein